MFIRKTLSTLFVLAVLSAACAPMQVPTNGQPAAGGDKPTPIPTATPIPSAIPDLPQPTPDGPRQINPAAEAARLRLSQEKQISYDAIAIIGIEAVEWPDSCLGISHPDVMCMQVITPGYRVTLKVDDQLYEYHTDESGSAIGEAAVSVKPSPNDPRINPAAVAVVEFLAKRLHLTDPNVIQLENMEPVEWANSCLGVEFPGMMCAQMITTGYKVTATVEGHTYVVHTDEFANAIAAPILLQWERTGGIAGFCQQLLVTTVGEAIAYPCRGMEQVEIGRRDLTTEEFTTVLDLAQNFGLTDFTQADPPNVSDAMSTQLHFAGYGTETLNENGVGVLMQFASTIITTIPSTR